MRSTRYRPAVLALSALLATVVALLTVVAGDTDRASAQETTVAAVGQVNPPALWLQLNETPTETQLQFAAKHYRVAVFNAWQVPALKRLKELNPAITVLMYKCLSSTRSYSGAYADGKDAAVLPTGVGYAEASQHPEWFATDTAGQRIQWSGYGGHWQMATWDPAYQVRWADNVAREVVAGGWDGVMADNAMARLHYYSRVTLADGRTDADLRSSTEQLVARLGSLIGASGKLVVPNVSDSRLYDGRWSRFSAYGGALEEQFMHWGTDPNSGYVPDWTSGGWAAQASEMAAPGLNLARTSAGPNDVRPYRYGLSSFWISGGGKGAFTAVAPDQYGGTPLRPEQTWDLGSPVTGMVKVGSAWTRTFSAGFAAVNPSTTLSAVVDVPAGMTDAEGNVGGRVTLAPLTGVIFRGPATTAPATAAPSATPSPTASTAVSPSPVASTPAASAAPATTSPSPSPSPTATGAAGGTSPSPTASATPTQTSKKVCFKRTGGARCTTSGSLMLLRR